MKLMFVLYRCSRQICLIKVSNSCDITKLTKCKQVLDIIDWRLHRTLSPSDT